MTVNSPRTSAPRQIAPASRGRLRARISAVVVAAILAVAPATSAASAATPSPSPTSPTGTTTFTLSPVSNGVVRPGDTLSVALTLQNDTVAEASAAHVTLSLGDAAFADRAALAAWLATQTPTVELPMIGSTDLPPVPAQSEETRGIQVAADSPALVGRAPGVYPLVASYSGPTGTVFSTSALIVPDDAAPQVGIGVVVPITAGPLTGGLLTAAELSELTAPDGSLTAQLNAVTGTDAILAVDPAILASIRVLGTSAPTSASAWLEHYEALTNTRFALQFGDADVAVQLQAGQSRPQQPTSLQAYMTASNFPPSTATPTASPDASPTPTPTPSATGPAYPSLAELLDVDATRTAMYWPATGTTTPEVVDDLGGLVSEDVSSLTLIPSTATTRGATGATVSARSIGDEAGLLVYDADISAALHKASLLGTAVRGASLTAATAYLAFAVEETDGRPLLVTLDRGTDRSPVSLGTSLRAATQAPGVVPVGLNALVDATPHAVEVADAAPNDTRVAAASALFEDETAIADFATVLDDSALLTGPERASILQLLGDGWLGAAAETDPTSWPTAIADHRAATTQTLAAVGILPPSTIQLISAGADLPVWVRNELPYPINVVLYSSPDDLRLEVQPQVEVQVAPSSNTKVEVPVQARVGNGEVTVALQLRSRTFEPIGDPQYADVNVRADWENIGLIAMSIIVGGLLTIGVVRTILRRRRGSADAPEADIDEETSDAAAPAENDAPDAATDAEVPDAVTDDGETPDPDDGPGDTTPADSR